MSNDKNNEPRASTLTDLMMEACVMPKTATAIRKQRITDFIMNSDDEIEEVDVIVDAVRARMIVICALVCAPS